MVQGRGRRNSPYKYYQTTKPPNLVKIRMFPKMPYQDKCLSHFSNGIAIPTCPGYRNSEVLTVVILFLFFLKGKAFIYKYLEPGMIYSLFKKLLLLLLFFFFYFTILYWFCHTSTCIHHGCTRVPHPEPPSHLPPHTIPLGNPSAPAPSFLYPALNLDWQFVSYMILYMF